MIAHLQSGDWGRLHGEQRLELMQKQERAIYAGKPVLDWLPTVTMSHRFDRLYRCIKVGLMVNLREHGECDVVGMMGRWA